MTYFIYDNNYLNNHTFPIKRGGPKEIEQLFEDSEKKDYQNDFINRK